MLKAIEILKNGIDVMHNAIKLQPELITHLENETNEYIKAIKELEELENRRCSDCKDKLNCHIYKHLGDGVKFLVYCNSFKKETK